MTQTQANNSFSIEEFFPDIVAAADELGAAIESELRTVIAEAAEWYEGEGGEEK